VAARSQNGWAANDRSVVASYQLPGGRIAIRAGDVSIVLLWVANQFHQRVEPLVWPGNWGYAERTVRGSSTTLSNHASGTAVDLNAPRHPLGKRGTFNAGQVREIRQILDYCEGVVRWGGDYTSRADEMHFEVNANAAAVRRLADKIRNQTAVQEDELSQQQVDQIIGVFRRDLGFVRDQVMTRLGVDNPPNAPAKLPVDQLRVIDPARRTDVGFARDQLFTELASHKALIEAQADRLDAQADLLEAIADKLGITVDPPGGN
jgi:hypothetical protein